MNSHLPDVDRPVVPFVGIVAIAFAAIALRTTATDWRLVVIAAVGAAGFSVLAQLVPWSRLSPAFLLVLPFAIDGVLALLRQAQGGSTSGYSPLAILPVAWVGLTQGRRAVAAISSGTALLFALPIALIGAPLYPTTGWRGVILLTTVAIVVGLGANRVVETQRSLGAVARSRVIGLNELVKTQNTIAVADLALDAMMRTVTEASLTLTGAEGACIELLDGDEMVCAAGAGVAVDYLGLRVKANASLSGECLRTRQVLICADSQQDSRAAREACQVVGARSLIVVPLLHIGEVKGVLIVWTSAAHDFKGFESQLLTLLANTISAALVRAELITKLTDDAVTDALTGLPNRRAWYEELEHALARGSRSRQPLTVLVLDLDGFKQVNDLQGHAAGDELLKSVTNAWAHELRATDLLGRIGGDEFAVVLELTDEAAAAEVVTRLDRALIGPCRASTGMAVWNGTEIAAALVARADAHMYERKRARTSLVG